MRKISSLCWYVCNRWRSLCGCSYIKWVKITISQISRFQSYRRLVSLLPFLDIIPRFTGGQTHFYPSFGPHDQAKMKHEIQALLSERIGLEAVMRTRCSPGLICKAFHGNCTTRVPDIMALPNVPQDQSYCVELELEEEIQSPYVYFQTALLYTTCFGERRIRVINLCIPVARSLPEVFSAADQVAIARTICHQGSDRIRL